MKKTLSTFLGFALALGPASAQVILYEGFDYDTPTIAGQEGGTGFSDGWGTSSGSSLDVVTPSLSYPGHYESNGNAVSVTGGGSSRSGLRHIDNAANYRAAGEVQWFSALANIPEMEGEIDIRFFGDANYEGPGFTFTRGEGATLLPTIGNGSGTNGPILSYNFDETLLIVGKIEWNTDTNATVSIWNSPTPTLNEAALGDAHSSITGDVVVGDGHWVRGNNGSAGIIDEIRLGHTLPDVIPEPSTYALGFGIFGLAIVFLRRRFQKR